MNLHDLHGTLCLMAAYGGQHVASEWLESFERFSADVTPTLESLPSPLRKSPALRLYRIDPAKPWCKANVAWAKPSGAKYPCDATLAVQEASRLDYLRRLAKRQNAYTYEMQEAA